jgi:MFS family permease
VVKGSDRSGEPRYTWGDLFLTLIPFAGLAYAIILASGLPADTERQAERAFWIAALGGGAVGGLSWRYQSRHMPPRSEAQRNRRRNVEIIRVVAPALGAVGGFLVLHVMPTMVKFAFLGAASAFLLAVMVGYAMYVRRTRSRARPPGQEDRG